MAQRPIMTFTELKAMQDAQAQAMPQQETVQHDTVPALTPAPRDAVSFAQIAAQQSIPMHTENTAVQPNTPAQHINNSIYAVNPYLDPRIEMPEPEPFDVTNLKYADALPADPLANTTYISGRRDDVYDRVYL